MHEMEAISICRLFIGNMSKTYVRTRRLYSFRKQIHIASRIRSSFSLSRLFLYLCILSLFIWIKKSKEIPKHASILVPYSAIIKLFNSTQYVWWKDIPVYAMTQQTHNICTLCLICLRMYRPPHWALNSLLQAIYKPNSLFLSNFVLSLFFYAQQLKRLSDHVCTLAAYNLPSFGK